MPALLLAAALAVHLPAGWDVARDADHITLARAGVTVTLRVDAASCDDILASDTELGALTGDGVAPAPAPVRGWARQVLEYDDPSGARHRLYCHALPHGALVADVLAPDSSCPAITALLETVVTERSVRRPRASVHAEAAST